MAVVWAERSKERRLRDGWSPWAARELAPVYEESQHPWGNPDLADRKSKVKRKRSKGVDVAGKQVAAAVRFVAEVRERSVTG